MSQIVKDILFGILWLSIVAFAGIILFNTISKPFADSIKNASEWPYEKGIVLRSGIDTLNTSDGKLKFCHDFVYKYTVDYKEYNGSKLKYASRHRWSSSTFFINRRINKYPAGAVVKVYYNPTNFKETFIKPPAIFVPILIKYLPLLFTFPMAILMFVAQIKGVFKSFKNEF